MVAVAAEESHLQARLLSPVVLIVPAFSHVSSRCLCADQSPTHRQSVPMT